MTYHYGIEQCHAVSKHMEDMHIWQIPMLNDSTGPIMAAMHEYAMNPGCFLWHEEPDGLEGSLSVMVMRVTLGLTLLGNDCMIREPFIFVYMGFM